MKITLRPFAFALASLALAFGACETLRQIEIAATPRGASVSLGFGDPATPRPTPPDPKTIRPPTFRFSFPPDVPRTWRETLYTSDGIPVPPFVFIAPLAEVTR